MASLFRARKSEEEEGRSGGKIVRGRRVRPASSPYERPGSSSPRASPTAVVVPASQFGSPKWLSGLISGAGKLISSVLPSYGAGDSEDSEEEEEDVSSGYDDEDQDDLPSRELREVYQRGNESELDKNWTDEPLAIITESETKLAIEQLLMQETFSRDECNKLTKLIQSRVVDLSHVGDHEDGAWEFPSRTGGGDIVLPDTSRSLSWNRNLQESEEIIPYSAYKSSTPDICNRAVMEAKKWYKDKKLASSSKCDPECGPCSFNTDMLQYHVEGDEASPVDIAKSYMRSPPPWRSPTLSSIKFRTPPSSGTYLYEDGTSYTKILKRDHLAAGSWDSVDETRRVRKKSADDILENSKTKQIESSGRLPEYESSKISTDNAEELLVGDHCSDHALRLEEKAIEVNHPFMIHNANSVNVIVGPEKSTSAVQSTHESSIACVDLPGPIHSEIGGELKSSNPAPNHTETGRELKPSNPDMLILDENQDAKEPGQAKEQAEGISVRHDLNGNLSTQGNIAENTKSAALSVADAITNLNDNMQNQYGVEGILQANNSSQLNVVSGINETDCIADSRPQDGNSQIHNEASSATQKRTGSSSSAENTNSDNRTSSKETDIVTNSLPHNGTMLKSVERMLTEPKPTTSRRGRKVVARSRRGRKS